MAIFHARVTPISRAAGHSTIAAAAYDARARMVDERTGEVHDHQRTHSHEVVAADLGVRFPSGPHPARWDGHDARLVVWNELERAEKRADANVGTRFEFALPRELSEAQGIDLARTIVEDFCAAGMVVDAVVHKDASSGYLHAHLLMSDRRVTADGWGAKSENLYLARAADGSERWANASTLRALQAGDPGAGWAKVYRYRLGRQTRELTDAQAASEWPAAKRKKNPVQRTRYFSPWHEHALAPDWLAPYHTDDDHSAAVVWRAVVALRINEALDAVGSSERVSPLSYMDRGIDKIPAVHEGPSVRAIEARARADASVAGVAYEPVTDAARRNAAIAAANRAIDLERRATAEIERRRQAAPHRPLPRPDADPLAPRPITNRPGAVRVVLAKASREGRVPPADVSRSLSRWGVRHARRMRIPILTAASDLGAAAAMTIARAAVSAVVRLVIAAVPGYRDRLRSHGAGLRRAWSDAHPSSSFGGSAPSASRSTSAAGVSTPTRSRSYDRGER